ncbi:MAG: BrnT family toxin [Sandaracinobacter sp.]
MYVEFDPAKDAANIAKHGVSLARAAELEFLAVVRDDRFSEQRYRIYGLLDDVPHCLAATLRNGVVRAISLRRAHRKEYRRHVA